MSTRMNMKQVVAVAGAALAVSIAAQSASARVDFGKEGRSGEPGHRLPAILHRVVVRAGWSTTARASGRRYLPEGSTAKFEIGLQGSVIVNAMTGEKQHIGLHGRHAGDRLDVPQHQGTWRHGHPHRRGTRHIEAAVQHLPRAQRRAGVRQRRGSGGVDGRQGDLRPARRVHGPLRTPRVQKAGIEPKRYLNQNIEVITTNFRAGKLDAAAIWEPTASKIVMGGIARRAASGEDFDALDGGFMVMLNDLITQRPDVHRGWLEAELDAQLYMLDPANARRRRLDGGGADRADRQGCAQALAVRGLAGEPGRRRGEGPARLHRHRTSAGAARRRDGVPVQPCRRSRLPPR